MKCDEIITGHENELDLISDNKVLGYFLDELSARVLKKGLEPGGFLVYGCIAEDAEWEMFYNANLAVGY